jgi:hypothetical protein
MENNTIIVTKITVAEFSAYSAKATKIYINKDYDEIEKDIRQITNTAYILSLQNYMISPTPTGNIVCVVEFSVEIPSFSKLETERILYKKAFDNVNEEQIRQKLSMISITSRIENMVVYHYHDKRYMDYKKSIFLEQKAHKYMKGKVLAH